MNTLKSSTQFHPESERRVSLTPIEQAHILKIDPSFELIVESLYFDNYNLPCPIEVKVKTNKGETIFVVVRKARHGSIEKEVKILKALRTCKLPVPVVLCEPFINEKGESVSILSFLQGQNLQKLSMQSGTDLSLAKSLLIRAVTQLTNTTSYLKTILSNEIPERSLAFELEQLKTSNNTWLQTDWYQAALEKLTIAVSNIKTPLVATNGDYQPGNFLAQNGKITGFLDFENPSFQDPLMGFVKYPIRDLQPLSRTNLIPEFLHLHSFSFSDFNQRLALGCLKAFKKEIPPGGSDLDTQEYRKRVFELLQQSLEGKWHG